MTTLTRVNKEIDIMKQYAYDQYKVYEIMC